jgi:hypothetical protein
MFVSSIADFAFQNCCVFSWLLSDVEMSDGMILIQDIY